MKNIEINKYFGKKYTNLINKNPIFQKVKEERELFVKKNIKIKNKKKLNILEIGCGDGKLLKKIEKKAEKSIGIEISKKMIKILNQNKLKKSQIYNIDILNYNTNTKFDVVIAIGLIEYLNRKKLLYFFKKIYFFLKKGGKFLLTSRNRLYNIVSFNNFTESERKKNNINFLIDECILATKGDTKYFIKKNKSSFKVQNFKNSKFLNIEVKNREQYTPGQLINEITRGTNFKVEEIVPLNFHILNKSILLKKKLLKEILSENKRKSLIQLPHSSGFGLVLKK